MFPSWLDFYIFVPPEWLNRKQRKISSSPNCTECLHSFLNLWSSHVPSVTVNLTCLLGCLLPFPMLSEGYAFVFQFTVHSFKFVRHMASCQLWPQSVTCFRTTLFLSPLRSLLIPRAKLTVWKNLPDKYPLFFAGRSDIWTQGF